MSLRGTLTRRDRLVLESAPLHTEEPKWAAHAPAQVQAACARGAHAIGLTETRGPVMAECQRVAEAHGYGWYGAPHDAHRNVTLLVKGGLHVADHGAVAVFNNYRVHVTFDFHGSPVTVYVTHWESTDKGHEVQSEALIAAMRETSAGKGLSFYMGDSNPRPQPQSRADSQPNQIMSGAGMPVIWRELDVWPKDIGVNVIGRNLADTRVKAVSGVVHPALGSDHVPATGVYSIRRARK